ncbi:MAG: helix-turn-helix transcriptional regulator [Frisingicoccus sp.]|uniref:helix-turn-helix domain-containing protein n=1 Tax=Frisingicoccus sp. TaxID=1918627 RepID=UPI002622977D|nr:helix-turn-helix transcriptional regulator [Frisingicoccus sp.]MDD6233379.1 helix-turn-helix transcriptional regulator [Frisingicoccus sp.]MDD6233408.1 helix-turn-helix transcriptional regulator [Frisingicoccus sp.]MDY4834908.1 helix-turn-helix transcriptional regulator [Frisingicoccus sp.]
MSIYGNLLKNLIGFSGVKLTSVSEAIGYDVSYISRWCNKETLPTIRASSEINSILANFFSCEISEHGDLEDFSDIFSVQVSTENLSSTIYDLLKNAYKTSIKVKNPTSVNLLNDASHAITSEKEIEQFFNQNLSEILSSYSEPLDIYCTLEICSFLQDNLFNFLENWEPEFDVHIRMALDEDALTHNSAYLIKLYDFIDSHGHLFLDFYDYKPMQSMNTLIVKNHLAVICALKPNSKILAATIITETEKINELYYHIISAFNSCNLLITTTTAADFYTKDYRANFYVKDNYQIFLSHGFEFLLPDTCWPSLYKKAYNQGEYIINMVNYIRVTWEEIFEKGVIDFFIKKSSLMDYIETGDIIFGCLPYTLTPKQRKDHVLNVLKVLKKNPNIHFYIIDNEQEMNTSVYLNPRTLFMKNLSLLYSDGTMLFHSVLSEKIVQKTHRFYEDLKSQPYCHKYTAEDVEKLYIKHSTLIYRMIDL